MTMRSPVLLTVAVGVLTIGCGPNVAGAPGEADTADGADTIETVPVTRPEQVIHPPPAQVLDATLVYFDPDGIDDAAAAPAAGLIDDLAGLDAFAERYVDGDPRLRSAAAAALHAGKVLIGGPVSSGCFPAGGAILGLTGAGIQLIPDGLPAEDPNVMCVRAITSIALVAILPADLPDAEIRGLW